MEEPIPRPLPQIGGFSSPHTELRDHAMRLRAQLGNAYGTLQHDLADASEMLVPPSIWDTKLYATAVTVFAAIAVEAALNAYGLMRFGPDQFERHFAFVGPVKRLRRLVKYAQGINLEETDVLVRTVKRLSDRRNALVHPRAHESVVDEHGIFRTPESAWQSPTDVKSADESIADMEQFFALFARFDSETAVFFRPFPLPRK